MQNQLMGYTSGQIRVPWSDRPIAKRAKVIYDETRIAAMDVEAKLALAGHMMRGVTELNHERKELAGDDVGLNMLLCDIETSTVRIIKRVQNGGSLWGF